MKMKRMMVIVREDLNPGLQIAQSIHAVAEYASEFPKKFKKWDNGYVIVLSVPNEHELIKLLFNIDDEFVDISEFREPDLDDGLTAFAFIEKKSTIKYTKDLPLAGNTTKTTEG